MAELKNNKDWPIFVGELAEQLGTGFNDNHDFIDWALKKHANGNPFDATLWGLAYRIQRKLQKNNDHFTVIVGTEGSGKSTLALNLAALVSQNFSVDYMAYDKAKFLELLDAPKKSTILLDEGAIVLFSRNAMSANTRDLIQLITLMRQLTYHVIICIPKLQILDRYLREERLDTLIYITERGKYTGFLKDGIADVNAQLTKVKKLVAVKTKSGRRWKGWFRKDLPPQVPEQDYLEAKEGHFKTILDQLRPSAQVPEDYWTKAQCLKYLKIADSTFNQKVNEYNLTRYSVGGKVLYKPEEIKDIVSKKVTVPSNGRFRPVSKPLSLLSEGKNEIKENF
jgi:energy-coupling factor transporter ATP-binding protein EcfA2